jgi:hypothetical protein
MIKVAAILSSLLCACAGLYLLAAQTQSGQGSSWFELIAHGMGIYFLGKACFVGPALWSMADKSPK